MATPLPTRRKKAQPNRPAVDRRWTTAEARAVIGPTVRLEAPDGSMHVLRWEELLQDPTIRVTVTREKPEPCPCGCG